MYKHRSNENGYKESLHWTVVGISCRIRDLHASLDRIDSAFCRNLGDSMVQWGGMLG